MSKRGSLGVCCLALLLLTSMVSTSEAQTKLPPPSGPVAFCGAQVAPGATAYKVVFDGGTPEVATMVTPASTGSAAAIVTGCNQTAPAGWTGAFTLPAARFTLGQHTVLVQSINDFGETLGPAYTLLIGIKPGQFTITAVFQLPAD